jgi:hypothetical protein
VWAKFPSKLRRGPRGASPSGRDATRDPIDDDVHKKAGEAPRLTPLAGRGACGCARCGMMLIKTLQGKTKKQKSQNTHRTAPGRAVSVSRLRLRSLRERVASRGRVAVATRVARPHATHDTPHGRARAVRGEAGAAPQPGRRARKGKKASHDFATWTQPVHSTQSPCTYVRHSTVRPRSEQGPGPACTCSCTIARAPPATSIALGPDIHIAELRLTYARLGHAMIRARLNTDSACTQDTRRPLQTAAHRRRIPSRHTPTSSGSSSTETFVR